MLIQERLSHDVGAFKLHPQVDHLATIPLAQRGFPPRASSRPDGIARPFKAGPARDSGYARAQIARPGAVLEWELGRERARRGRRHIIQVLKSLHSKVIFFLLRSDVKCGHRVKHVVVREAP